MTNTHKTPQRQLDAARRHREKKSQDPLWVEKRKKYMQEYLKKYSSAHKEKLNAQSSERYYAKDRYQYRLRRLGITPTDALLSKIQTHSGICDICSATGDGRWKELSIDHCHGSGTFRGMLCSSCNRALGLFKDNTQLLQIAIEYLNQHRKMIESQFK